MPEKAGAHCHSGHCRHANTDRKEGDRQKISHLPLYFKRQFCSGFIASKRQFRSGFIAGKSQLPLRIDCRQTSVLLRLLVVVQRAACGEVVDLALDVLKNCLVLFGTFLGDTVDNIGVLCDG